MHRRASGLALVLFLGSAEAQALVWDVPTRGAIVYQRRVEELRSVSATWRGLCTWAIPVAEDGGHEWRFWQGRTGQTPPGFTEASFDDSSWEKGRAMFGADANDAQRRSQWNKGELCLRTRVDLGRNKPRMALFAVHHDDEVEIWWNNHLVVKGAGSGRDRVYAVSVENLDAAFQRGDNLLCARCVNQGGAQYLDVGLLLFSTLPPNVKTPAELAQQFEKDRNAGREVHGWFCGGYRPPGLLLHGELAASQDRVRLPPGDVRELGWYCGMDLSRAGLGGNYSVDVPRLYRLGDLQIKGRFEPTDATGWQSADLQLRTLPEPLAREDTNKFVHRWVEPHCTHGFEGRLQLRRRIEMRSGKARVVELQVEMTGDVLRNKNKKDIAGVLRQRERWQFDSVRENRDAKFRADVIEALRRGTAHLRDLLQRLDSNDLRPTKNAEQSHPSGRLAIGVLALIKGGVPRNDPVLAAAVAELRRRELVDTYSLGIAMMALEAVHAPPNEIADLQAGLIDRPAQRRVPAEDRQIMQAWADQLLQNIDTRPDPATMLRFNYTRGERFDNSVNQYGLLGMYAAQLCGVKVAPSVWEAAANHLLASQGSPRGVVELELTDYRTFTRAQNDPSVRVTAVRTPVRAAGWGYQDPKDTGEDTPVFGSMTVAGIAGLSICEAGLLSGPEKRPRLLGEISQARTAAFAWLAQNLQVRYHPGFIDRQQHWFFYYLYGLERAALLSGIALIQGRDWYFEGAMVLVGAQAKGGEWPGELWADNDIERTAMAILFLKLSTLPVLTGK